MKREKTHSVHPGKHQLPQDPVEPQQTGTAAPHWLPVLLIQHQVQLRDGCGDAANAHGANQPQMLTVAPGAAGLSSFNSPRILISIIPFESFQRRRSHEGEFILFYFC